MKISTGQTEKATMIRVANDLLRQATWDAASPGMEHRIKTEITNIRVRLDRLAFAVQYPEQAEKNQTLDK